ncbi:hypothetical protein OESDEN_11432 [Oesophagostomum dentatum]|uniref:Uncharacterized protein n=1 Tax=Oesophagostomum dentatum TaxID=61180 RepID=A0A0B1T029_OESDE|nr:hypothetical protein OESDEN_11432 [Oesophagostomum dentatum]
MHLYTPGEGLLGTHVTWKDIEEDMQRELHTNASFGPKKNASNIGEGKGFGSKILLINPDWQNKDRDLPEQFVVKILIQLPLPSSPASIPAIPMEEVKIKEFLTGTEEFLKLIYYAKAFSETNPVKGYIIMEYVENVKLIHIYENVPVKAIKQQSHMGCGAEDLVRLFATCLSSSDRREHADELLEEFYAYLKEEMGNDGMPYTFEQLKKSYQLFLPLGLFLSVPMFGLCLGPSPQHSSEQATGAVIAY